MKKIPFIVKENFLDEDSFSQVVEETRLLMPHFYDAKFGGSAKENDKILKQNKILSYDEYYRDNKNASNTVKIFRQKIFDSELYGEFKNQVIVDLAQSVDWDEMMISYYEDGDHYKPHYDSSFITGLYWFDIKPRKFAGGELLLYNGTKKDPPEMRLQFQPVNNRFIAFPGCYMHEVKSVVMSERWKGQGHGRFCISIFCGHRS